MLCFLGPHQHVSQCQGLPPMTKGSHLPDRCFEQSREDEKPHLANCP